MLVRRIELCWCTCRPVPMLTWPGLVRNWSHPVSFVVPANQPLDMQLKGKKSTDFKQEQGSRSDRPTYPGIGCVIEKLMEKVGPLPSCPAPPMPLVSSSPLGMQPTPGPDWLFLLFLHWPVGPKSHPPISTSRPYLPSRVVRTVETTNSTYWPVSAFFLLPDITYSFCRHVV